MNQSGKVMRHELPIRSEAVMNPSSRRERRAGAGALWFGIPFFALVVSVHAADPEIAVSVNGRGSAVVFQGMPLLITGVFVSPGAADCSVAPVVLAAGQGPWTNAVTLEIRTVAGDAQSWPLHTAIAPSNSISLDCTNYAQIDWWLTPAETSLVSTGSYTISLVLNTTNAPLPEAWKGVAEAVPAEVNILNQPATLSEAEAENKYSQLALYQLFLNNGQGALDQIKQLLTLFPTNIAGLRIQSKALDSLGRTVEAYRACEQAIAEVFARNPDPQEPPMNLFRLRQELETTLLTPLALEYALTNQQVQLNWSGYPGLNYRLETSSDLSAWSLLTTNFTIVSNRFSFSVDLNRDRQFLRVAR